MSSKAKPAAATVRLVPEAKASAPKAKPAAKATPAKAASKAKPAAKATPVKATPAPLSLAEVAAAKRFDPAAALAAVVATWQENPAAELAELAHRVAAVAGRDRKPITGTSHEDLHAAWLAVEAARDPVDLDRLLATLTAGRCEACIDRLAKLAAWPADPRMLAWLVGTVESDPRLRRGEASPVPFTSQANRAFWHALLALLEERGNATVSARLRAVASRKALTNFEEWLAGKLTKLATVFDARVPDPAADPDAIAAIDRQLAAAHATEEPAAQTADALLDAVWAAPDDDAPRQVLADFLQQRDDPRGEFIMLQLARAAGTLDKAGKAREKELLKRHKKQWLGPIEPLLQPYNQRFERGFLVTCQLEPNAELEAKLASHPAWSTIREYVIHYPRTAPEGRAIVERIESFGAVRAGRNFTRGVG
ncbi:MAG: TIGR02996 domain-containing protein [Kofleriaceae bacterium]